MSETTGTGAIDDIDIVECIGLVRGELLDDARADAADAELRAYRALVTRAATAKGGA